MLLILRTTAFSRPSLGNVPGRVQVFLIRLRARRVRLRRVRLQSNNLPPADVVATLVAVNLDVVAVADVVVTVAVFADAIVAVLGTGHGLTCCCGI